MWAALMAGAGLAATAAGGPSWGIVSLLAGGAAGNQFHDAIKGAGDWYTEWTSGPGGAARNFDITVLAARAIRGITHKAAQDYNGHTRDGEMVQAIADLRTEHWEAALRSPGFEALGDEQLVQLTGLHHGGINDHAATGSVWAELIKTALLAASPKASVNTLTPKQAECLAFTARRLWERFAVQFNGELRSDPKHGGRALVAVQLLLANRTREEVARVDEAVRTGTTEIVDALDEAAGRLRDRLKRLEDKHDAHEEAESERHAILAQTVADIPGSRVLGRLLVQPWARPRKLPFHFSVEEVSLHGDLALSGLPTQVTEFLNRPDPAHWWLWTGLEGAGKSRLAMEACKLAEKSQWDAGFLPLQVLRELKSHWHNVTLARDTLVVCDYVGLDTAAVRSALVALGQHRDDMIRRRGGHKLRLILLERHSNAVVPTSAVNLPPQWCVDLFQSPLSGAEFLDRQYPEPGCTSLHVRELLTEEALPFALECVRRARGTLAASAKPGSVSQCADTELAARVLAILPGSGRSSQLRPLHILLTAFVFVTLSHSADTFEKVITEYLRHRVELRKHDFSTISSDVADVDRIFNLVCVATILRTIDLKDVPNHTHLPGERFRVNPGRLMTLMGQSPDSTAVQGLEPDLIGEWFVRLWCGPQSKLGGRLPYPHLAEILDEIPHANTGVADFVQRTYRYPEFRDRALWKRLRSRLGRYSTPFGCLFDKREKQQALLGGRTKQAEERYSSAIDAAIRNAVENRGCATLVDLMAGGSERCSDLLRDHPDLRVISIDRDISRLKPLESRYPKRIFAVRREIDGQVGLAKLLHQFNAGEPCDIVIAKKALHEIPWSSQVSIVREVGENLTRTEGRCIIYADSPDFIDAGGRTQLSRIVNVIRRDELGSAQDQRSEWVESDVAGGRAAEVELEAASHARILRFMMGLHFDPNTLADAAVFANMWIALKDWANYNVHECLHRYFSSVNELTAVLSDAGLTPRSPQDGIFRFHMTLQAARFVEDAINRIGYMCSDSTVTDDELRRALSANPRFGVFRQIVEHHLWADASPTAFGRSSSVNAARGEPFDLDNFVMGMNTRFEDIDFESITGPTFDMPVHVFCLTREA